MRLLYQSAGGSALLLADDRDEYYVVQLVGKVSKKNYQTALREIIKNLDADAYTCLLLNLKDLQSQPDLAGYWFWAHFIPRFYKKAGKCKVAIVRAKQTTWRNQLSKVSSLFRVGKLQLDVRFFDTLPTAQDWLIDGILPETSPSDKKKMLNLPNPFRTNKKYQDEEEENEDWDEDEEPKKKKRFFVYKVLDWIKERINGLSFLKKIKVKVKFDPKGRLGEDEE